MLSYLLKKRLICFVSFVEEDLSEFFYYQDGEEWKYDLK